MKTKVNPKIKQFAFDSLLEAKQAIRCGFELETQETEGYTESDCEDDGICEYRLDDLVDSDMEDVDVKDLIDNHGDDDSFFYNLDDIQFREVSKVLFDTEYPSLNACAKFDTIDEEYIFNAERDSQRDYILENWSEYNEGSNGDPEDLISAPRGMIIELDQSVSGFELRTDGPKKYSEFIRCANDVFKMSHEIDVSCSFHIHLSIPGIRPLSGGHMVKRLTQYIIDHQSELPESVLERFRQVGKSAGRFFRPKVGSEGKSTAINCHSQGTWEFRCFGNVTNAADAKKCLDIAIRALHWAYRVRFKLEPFDSLPVTNEQWEALAVKAMEQNKTLLAVYQWENSPEREEEKRLKAVKDRKREEIYQRYLDTKGEAYERYDSGQITYEERMIIVSKAQAQHNAELLALEATLPWFTEVAA